MKLAKWIALLLMSAILTSLTACNFGQPISEETTKQTTSSEKSSLPSVTTTANLTTTATEPPGPTVGKPFSPSVIGDQLDALLKDLTNLTKAGKINLDSLRVECESFTANEGISNLFDQTEAQWVCERVKDVDYNKEESDIWVLFSTTEAVTVSAYVLTTGKASEDQQYNFFDQPVEWDLYGTNDPAVFAAETPSEAGWSELDCVYDGGVSIAVLYPNGYTVDDFYQAPYQYYALVFGYTDGPKLMLSELELYIEE